jgi:hypothetical protein
MGYSVTSNWRVNGYSNGDRAMEAIVLLLVMIVGFTVIAGASLTWGVDSRESYLDDHQR